MKLQDTKNRASLYAPTILALRQQQLFYFQCCNYDDEVELSILLYFWHTYYQEYRPSTGIFSFLPHLFHAATLPWETVEN